MLRQASRHQARRQTCFISVQLPSVILQRVKEEASKHNLIPYGHSKNPFKLKVEEAHAPVGRKKVSMQWKVRENIQIT
eukprot:scaffold1297_cov368-Prasinococcus_capsulatus_cf.AAC.13